MKHHHPFVQNRTTIFLLNHLSTLTPEMSYLKHLNHNKKVEKRNTFTNSDTSPDYPINVKRTTDVVKPTAKILISNQMRGFLHNIAALKETTPFTTLLFKSSAHFRNRRGLDAHFLTRLKDSPLVMTGNK